MAIKSHHPAAAGLWPTASGGIGEDSQPLFQSLFPVVHLNPKL